MKTLVMIAVALAIPCAAYAEDDRAVGGVGGALGGAAVGTAVGGPVGAVVGAGIGAIVGSSLPNEPSTVYNGPVVVGEPLPQSVVVYPLPQYPDYTYAVINNQRVIVDRSHRIVRVIE
ncbi:MAG: DUF1236 domain-containing protein [Hyphomicrobiales bacterium]|nr:DUF1236 domain-containing protein [Hyphomicrobiales bacterium]MBV8442946.1 DUF1236 domain-containing protein [Hyphomicrobiales bacterium]